MPRRCVVAVKALAEADVHEPRAASTANVLAGTRARLRRIHLAFVDQYFEEYVASSERTTC